MQIRVHTFRVRCMHCSSHCEYIYNYTDCSSSLIQSFMSFWEEMESFGHRLEVYLLLWLSHGATERWQPQYPPLAWSKWLSASENSHAVMSLLLICMEEQW